MTHGFAGWLHSHHWRSALALLHVLCLSLLLGDAPPAQAQKDVVTAERLLTEITDYQTQLKSRRAALTADIKQAETDDTDRAADLRKWQSLAEQFVFNAADLDALQTEIKRIQAAKDSAEAHTELQAAKQRYAQLLDTFELIGKSIEAENRAALTQMDSKMYYSMRVRSKVPPKTLKAYGLMELARQERDQGKFTEALQIWAQAEQMVRESFEEHIAEMARWREQTMRNAEAERAQTKAKVEALLADYFVAIPAGSFMMGGEHGGTDEGPVRKVTLPAFKLGKTEVTFELYDLCVASSSCYSVPKDEGWGRDQRPVVNVSYRDITRQFLPWLNGLTGRDYRLPSEAEWEYAARAGSTTEYAWGDNISCDLARYDGGAASVCNARAAGNRGTVPVKSFSANAFGLYDLHGNTWEWVEDCWNPNYSGAPTDGSAWIHGNCEVRVLRGGAWDHDKASLRSANRFYFAHKTRKSNFGFRLASNE